jgi:hypothetical protein
MTDQPTTLSLDGATILALEEIRKKGSGLFSQVLILTSGAQDFSNDETSYRSPIFDASSGGSDSFLKATDYHNPDEAKLSGKDSEVAALQDAWDWLDGHPQAYSPLIVLVCNIGPCDACKQRLTNFRAKCDPYYAGNLTVQVVYGQSGSPAKETTRGPKEIKTTYGYQGAGTYTLGNGTTVWLHTVT